MKSVLLTFILSVSALVMNAIDLNFSFNAPTCNGFTNGIATVTASGGVEPYAYAWSNGQSGQSVLGIGAGTYTATVTDQNGVTATGTVAVTEPSAIVLAFSQTGPNCDASFSPVTADVTGGTPGYTYSWSTGATTATITPGASGNVFITVADAAGCAVAGTYYVPVPSQIFTSYFAVAPQCFGGNSGTVTPNIVGNYTPHTWVWSTGTNANGPLTGVTSGNYGVTVTDQQGCFKAESVFVPTQAPLQVLPFMMNVLCHGTQSGTGTAIGSGGVNPYSFLWSTGQTDPIIQNLGVNTYTVTLTDGNGCVTSSSAVITEPAQLTNSIISITPACGNNGSATVQPAGGTPPYNIVWNSGQFNGPTISGVPAGSYYVCTFDANYCQLDLVVEIPGVPGLNVVLVTEKASCVGVNDGVATAIATGGSGNYAYAWSNGAASVAQINGLAAGQTITVTVTDLTTGCLGTATATIATHNQLITQVNDTDVLCANEPAGTATATVLNGTAPYAFVWNVNGNPVNGPTITGLPAGAYPVTITDAAGCTAVNVANGDASGAADAQFVWETVYCDSNLVKIKLHDLSTSSGGTIVSWQWVAAWGTGSALFGVQNPPILGVPANSSGTIQLTIITSAGCTDLLNVPFEVGEMPIVSIGNNEPRVNCEGGAVPIYVTGNPAYNYVWSPLNGLTFVNNDPQNVSANPSVATTYQLIANSGGCKDTLSVTVLKNVPFQVTLPNVTIKSCEISPSLSATLDVPNNGFDIDWFNAAGDSIATGITVAVPVTDTVSIYTVVVTDGFGCTETAQASVLGIGVDVDATSFLSQVEACENSLIQVGIVNIDANDTLIYLWSVMPPDLTISDPVAPNPTIIGPAGNYVVSVVVTNQYGCEKIFTSPLTLDPAGSLVNNIATDLCKGLSVDFENTSVVPGTWIFGDGDTSIVNDPTHGYAAPGSYIVSFVPDDVCFKPFIDTIQVLSVPAVVAQIDGQLADCFGVANFDFTDSTQYVTQIATWQWTFTPGNQTSTLQNPEVIFTQEGPITATLVVTDINGCRDTSDTVTLQSDIVHDSIATTASLCIGGTVQLNPDSSVANSTYTWTANPADPSLVSGAANPTVSPSIPTIYSVSVVKGNCTVNQEIAVAINEAANVKASNDTVSCGEQLVTISAASTNAFSFAWSHSRFFNEIFATGPVVSISPVSAGMNYVMVTTPQGCPAIDSVMVIFGSTDVTANPDITPVCNGISATLNIQNTNATDVLTYVWTNGLPAVSNPQVNPSVATNYSAIVTNQFGCKDTLDFSVVPTNLNLDIKVTANDTIAPGESVILGAAVTGGQSYTYDWSPTSTLNDGSLQAPTATPTENTTYSVVATDVASGCTMQGDVLIVLFSPECTDPFTFVPLAFSPNGDGSNDFFRVRGFNMTEMYFAVWNRWGEKLYETKEIEHEGWDGTIRGISASPDAYAWYARVVCGNGLVWERKGNVTLLR